jgi:hypothetical protein
MTGLWDLDPDDSAWYHLEQKDKNDPSIVVPMGSICYRYDILGAHVVIEHSIVAADSSGRAALDKSCHSPIQSILHSAD